MLELHFRSSLEMFFRYHSIFAVPSYMYKSDADWTEHLLGGK